jgi:hypothetical protein
LSISRTDFDIYDRGYLKEFKPYAKQIDAFIEQILSGGAMLYFSLSFNKFRCWFSGNKFTTTATNILLMVVAILLVALLLQRSEKPKMVTVVEKKHRE